MEAPILVAVEAVPEASIVIAAARRMAAGSRTPVLVLSVREREYSRGLVWDRRPMTDIAEVINSAIFEFDRADIPARGLVRTTRSGQVAEEILDAAREHRVRTIVIGTSSRSRLGSLILGSVSPRLVRHCEVPVVLVPISRRKTERQPAFSRSGSAAAPNR
ncbi:MAG TPA: universal stress protein [Candidatus Dormibacteraeota bacterium]|nr:universal stress protein [Candidatus Dormibacteraeota bacterium]